MVHKVGTEASQAGGPGWGSPPLLGCTDQKVAAGGGPKPGFGVSNPRSQQGTGYREGCAGLFLEGMLRTCES